jgi:hypothetical protein
MLALVAAFTSAVAMLGLNRLQGVHPWAVVAHFSGVATAFVLAGWMVGGVPPLDTLRDPITLRIAIRRWGDWNFWPIVSDSRLRPVIRHVYPSSV